MRKYLVVYEKTKTGYSAYVPDLPGVIATGKTKAIIEKRKDIVYLASQQYKVGSYMFLIHQPVDNKILFFVKGDGGFDTLGFENIKNNKPYQN